MSDLERAVREALDRLVDAAGTLPDPDWHDVRARVAHERRRGSRRAGPFGRAGLGLAGAGALIALIVVLIANGPHSEPRTPGAGAPTSNPAVSSEASEWSAGYAPVTGLVVARSPADWYRGARISVGTANGVVRGAPVVASGGTGGVALVGVVAGLSKRTAEVAFITDGSTKVGATIAGGTGIPAVVQSTRPGVMTLSGVPQTAPVKVGQVVVTSGLSTGSSSSIFPQGIEIGRVAGVGAPHSRAQRMIRVTPSVDPRTFTSITVLSPQRATEATTHARDLPSAPPPIPGHFFLSPTASGVGAAAARVLGRDYRVELVRSTRVNVHGSLRGSDTAMSIGASGDSYRLTRFVAFSRTEMESQGFAARRAASGTYWVTSDQPQLQALTFLSSGGVGVRLDHLSGSSPVRATPATLLALASAASAGLRPSDPTK